MSLEDVSQIKAAALKHLHLLTAQTSPVQIFCFHKLKKNKKKKKKKTLLAGSIGHLEKFFYNLVQ